MPRLKAKHTPTVRQIEARAKKLREAAIERDLDINTGYIGETEPSWFISSDNWLYMRWGGEFETVTRDELIVQAHGRNDVDARQVFPPLQQERFQPARPA